MNLQEMLESSILLNRQIEYNKQINWTADNRLQNAYVALDVELSEVANTAEWFKVWKENRGKHDENRTNRETLIFEYVDVIYFYMLIANLKNWNRVITDSQEKIGKLKLAKKEVILNKQYLAIKQMLFNSYFNKDMDAFKHSWMLFLKLGIVDFGFSEAEITKAFNEKNKINYDRQNNHY